MIIQASDLIPEGKHVLWREGCPVWFGPIGMPIEDIECDKIQVNPADYDRIRRALEHKT